MKSLSLAVPGCLIAIPAVPDTKLTSAELTAKHLASIGSAETRTRVRGTKIKGSASVRLKLCGEGQVDGQKLISSLGRIQFEVYAPLNPSAFTIGQEQKKETSN